MTKVIKKIALCAISAFWAAGVWFGMRAFPVGIAFQPQQEGQVSLVAVYPDGREAESARKMLQEDGHVAFDVDRSAKTFYFRLYNKEGGRRCAWSMRDIRIFGIPAISAKMVPRFEMWKKLYVEPPSHDGAPLVMAVDDGDPLNLPNVFPYLLHVLAAFQGIVAVLPLLLLVMFFVIMFFRKHVGKVVWDFLNREGVFCGIVIVAMALTLPAPVTPAVPGLDSSWMWLMNRFAGEPVFGKDFVFTYGPLGFLIAPQVWGANVAIGMVVNVFFPIFFGGLTIFIHRSFQFEFRRSASYLLLALWLLAWPNGMEWKWCLVSITVCAFAVLARGLDRRIRCLLFAFAAMTAVLQSFVKFSSCVAVLGQHLFLLMFGAWREKRRMLPDIGIYLLTAFASGVLMAFFLFPSLSSFFAWIRGSLEIASGYNLAMGGDKPWPELASTFAFLLLFLVFLLVGKASRRSTVKYWFLFSPFLFCTYKYAIVRQSGIPLMLGIAWLAALSMVLVQERIRRSVAMVAFYVCAAAMLGVVWRNECPRLDVSFRNMLANLFPARAMHQAIEDAKLPISAARLPSAWLDRIGTNRVMIAGIEMGPAMSGDLELVPFPATQTYSAYTPHLDQCCAERVAREGDDAVRFILVPANPWSFDSRNIYFDNPQLWRTVRRHFRFLAQNPDHVLLERRLEPIPLEMTDRNFTLRRPFFDKLMTLIFRPTRAMAHFSFSNGKTYSCFANLEILNGTPVPQTLPTTPEEVATYFGDTVRHLTLITQVEIVLNSDVLFAHKR